MKLSKQLSGVAGEYYVAAELSRRGYLAAITLRNSDGVDILASSLEDDNTFQIQVKTTQNKTKWPLSHKVEGENSDKKFFVFVSLPADPKAKPEYYIISAKNLGKHIYDSHRNWLITPGKKGQQRNNTNIRQFDPQFIKKEDLLNWDSLIAHLN